MTGSIPVGRLIWVLIPSQLVGGKKLTYFLGLSIFWWVKRDLLIRTIHVLGIRLQIFIMRMKYPFIFVVSFFVNNHIFLLFFVLNGLFSIFSSQTGQCLLFIWSQKPHLFQILQLQNLFSFLGTAIFGQVLFVLSFSICRIGFLFFLLFRQSIFISFVFSELISFKDIWASDSWEISFNYPGLFDVLLLNFLFVLFRIKSLFRVGIFFKQKVGRIV